jgi:hypothetical protein
MNKQNQLEIFLYSNKLLKIKTPYHRTCYYLLTIWLSQYNKKARRESILADLLLALKYLPERLDKDDYIRWIKIIESRTNEYLENTPFRYYLSPHKILKDILTDDWELHKKRFARYKLKKT